ncbi:MAG TPA: nuclear transport factor 2 family protein [Bauldia sp.]|mgnify:CR=1 FL=1|nr:nuclear transport factor 2 family protein [Bauldia sp.]
MVRKTMRSGLLFAAAMAIATALPLSGATTPARAAETSTELAAEANAAIEAWFVAIRSHDPEKLRAIVAPEFQIMRADGSGYGAADYPTSKLPVINALPKVDELVVTKEGDIMVARYMTVIDSTRDGKTVEARAPRLTVFRKVGDTWLVVAHGNFAALQ